MSIPCDKTFVFVPTSRSSVKVKVKYQGHSFQKIKKKKEMAVAEDWCCTNISCFFSAGRVENSVGEKRENADNHHFLLSPKCFKNASYMGVV